MKRLGEILTVPDSALRPLPVSGIAVDSRRVGPGTLFVAIKGVHQDGHAHAEEAARAGIGIYRYQPGFVHQKVLLVDDDMAAIGSASCKILKRFYRAPRALPWANAGWIIIGPCQKTRKTLCLKRICKWLFGTICLCWCTTARRTPMCMPCCNNIVPKALCIAIPAAPTTRYVL